jgi:excisionase family DNA binding protein
MLDVRAAAALAGRHPETIRRWVRSGRLAGRRTGNRLLVARGDVEALAGEHGFAPSPGAWAERAQALRETRGVAGTHRSAADLVLGNRAERSMERVSGR